MKYQKTYPISRQEFEDKVNRNEPDELCFAIINLSLYEADTNFVHDSFLKILSTTSSHPVIDAIATGAIHLARLRGNVRADVLSRLGEINEPPTLRDNIKSDLEEVEHWQRIFKKENG